jgi:hypothetical protein
VDGARSKSCPVTNLFITDVEPSDSASIMLVTRAPVCSKV